MKEIETTTPTLTNSEVALIKKGLEMLDSVSLGFESSVKKIIEKLKPSGKPA